MFDNYETSIPIIKDKLYFICVGEDFRPPSSAKTLCFTTDTTLVYTAFFADFGPLHLGLTYQFCNILDNHLKSAVATDKVVVYYCSDHPQKRANAATLICAYLIFVLNYTAEQAYSPFIGLDPPFIPFRDAAFSINTFPITVLDTARAFHRAVSCGHFSYRTFSVSNFTNMAKLENGDFSWIIPGKFIAFSGPISRRRDLANGMTTLLPEEYVPRFKELGVTCIIRFNNKLYDKNVFTRAGIRHVDLFYEDGGNPSDAILQSFLQICERESGAIAVHCKAGLGRTGTNIAAYMMKHWNYTAKESIAWCRICRPGSVVGPQQQYLAAIEVNIRPKQTINLPPAVAATLTQTGEVGIASGGSGSVLSGRRSRTMSEEPILEKTMNVTTASRSKTPPVTRSYVSQSLERGLGAGAGSVGVITSANNPRVRRVTQPMSQSPSGDHPAAQNGNQSQPQSLVAPILPRDNSAKMRSVSEKTSLFTRGPHASLMSSNLPSGSGGTGSPSRPHTSGGGSQATRGGGAAGLPVTSFSTVLNGATATRERSSIGVASRGRDISPKPSSPSSYLNSKRDSDVDGVWVGHNSSAQTNLNLSINSSLRRESGATSVAASSRLSTSFQRPKTGNSSLPQPNLARTSPVRVTTGRSNSISNNSVLHSSSSRPISSRYESRGKFA